MIADLKPKDGHQQIMEDARRILPTVDLIAHLDQKQLDQKQIEAFVASRQETVTHFYVGLQTLQAHYQALVVTPTQHLPTHLAGIVLEPDGSLAQQIMVSAQLLATGGKGASSGLSTITDEHGAFILKLPPGTPAAPGTAVTLVFKGANGTEAHDFTLAQVGNEGMLDTIQLQKTLQPVPQSIVSSLASVLGWATKPVPTSGKPDTAPPPIQVKLGDDDHPITFTSNLSEERFPYSVLIRLVEPRTSIVTPTLVLGNNANGFYGFAQRKSNWASLLKLKSSFADRVPVDQPISVDGFRDRIMGNENGAIAAEETVPMAGTLGLGYIVRMAQQWTPRELSLGDLVYSLPLAPGEQQRIAIMEQRQTISVSERELLDVEEQRQEEQKADSSTQATFDSAFTEAVHGSSSYATHAESSSWGVGGGLGAAISFLTFGVGAGVGAAGGSGSADTKGNAEQALDGARNYSSAAAETMHSAVERQASARRRAQRTSIRLASASDVETATTKIITNNNRAHALTVQYWEVLRHFDVTTTVEGVTLVCFVPLEVVRFLSAGQSVSLDPDTFNIPNDPDKVKSRAAVLQRYGQLLKHADIVRAWLPRAYRTGLNILEEFAADPRAVPDSPASAAEDVIAFHLKGSFLPFEDIYVSAVTRRGTRLGSARLSGTIKPLPDRLTDPAHAFSAEADLMAELERRRADDTGTTLQGFLTLPSSVAPSDIIGFELTRTFRPLTYQLVPKPDDPATQMVKTFFGEHALDPSQGLFASMFMGPVNSLLTGVRLTPAQLESELGGPFIWDFSAWILADPNKNHDDPQNSKETYVFDYIDNAAKEQMPTGTLPIPALQVKPLLKFDALLKIEQTLQHVVRNTITYSKAVWMSLTPEERAIMLEGYTIGLPADGIQDDTQHIPLLNCVANQVLGFYGNAMILPFSLPPAVAQHLAVTPDPANAEHKLPLTTGQIQEALTNFHRGNFSPPISHIALPTHGVLAEAVLGNSPSAEKIDLTRFWNWADSPIPQADTITGITLGKGNTLTGLQAPNTLTALPAMITNVNSGAGTASDGQAILKALIDSGTAAAGKDLPNLTGSTELANLTKETLTTGEKARADALGKAQSLATEALHSASEILKGNAESKTAAKKDATDQKGAKDAKVKVALENLKTNADTYLKVADAQKDQATANAYAKKVVSDLAGGEGIPVYQAYQLYTLYRKTKTDTEDMTQGSKAFLAALGLPQN